MIQGKQKRLSRTALWGWRILIIVSALLVLNGIVLYFFVADSRLMQTTSILESGLGLLALNVAWAGFRHHSRWAWHALWVLVALLGVLTVHILISGDLVVSSWYLFLATVTLIGQLLAGRNGQPTLS